MKSKIKGDQYSKAVITYLSIWFDRIIARNNSFTRWHTKQDTIEHPFGRQAIPWMYDYPEMNPFSNFSGGSLRQLQTILEVIETESKSQISANFNNISSGNILQYDKNYFDSCITDPPYYDAISYGDLSDFFYVWQRLLLQDEYPHNFSTPSTPKSEECTALKFHHANDKRSAELHFEGMLTKIFEAIRKQTHGVISIMFAHQSTKAWTTLCNSILKSKMNLFSSWAIETELSVRMVAIDKNALASSVTVACKPEEKSGIGDYKEVRKEILYGIKKEISNLYNLGFRGADLLTACFGKAVSVFGEYQSVEKADGSVVTVAELLEMAKEAAFNAIVSDIDTDELTKFYIGWLNLFSFSEAVHDDVRRISQIGLSAEMNDIYNQNILVKDNDKGILGSMLERINADSRLGLRPVNNNDIDVAHRLMFLFNPSNASRSELLDYIADKTPNSESSVWRVLNSLAELLPKSKDMKDQELAIGLLQNQENLLREAKNREDAGGVQTKLGFE